MKIRLNSVYVDDQDKALKFYTEILGFVKKMDIPMGKYRWLTVVSPEDPTGTELVLEPGIDASTQSFKRSLYEAGKPLTAFEISDIQREYERLKNLGVSFSTPPRDVGPIFQAIFDDNCGNLIQLYQIKQ
jgi:catechol 2,3-dioxygenase-like lactoylglutathione lyase family enzyme